MKVLFYIILTKCVLVTGCYQVVVKESVEGDYTAEYLGSIDSLSILSDGSYIHLYEFNGSEQVNRGTWLFESLGNDREGITFNGFTFRDLNPKDHSLAILKDPAIWHVSPESGLFGNISLCFYDDLSWCFIKRD